MHASTSGDPVFASLSSCLSTVWFPCVSHRTHDNEIAPSEQRRLYFTYCYSEEARIACSWIATCENPRAVTLWHLEKGEKLTVREGIKVRQPVVLAINQTTWSLICTHPAGTPIDQCNSGRFSRGKKTDATGVPFYIFYFLYMYRKIGIGKIPRRKELYVFITSFITLLVLGFNCSFQTRF